MRHFTNPTPVVSRKVRSVPAAGEPLPARLEQAATFDLGLGGEAPAPSRSTSSRGEPADPDGTRAAEPLPSAASHNPDFWRHLYVERAGIRQYEGSYTHAEAEHLAWSELQSRWHMEHGERAPRHLCAGCRRLIGGKPVLDLIDGCRVHADEGYDCLIRWGQRWRVAATRALVAMGLKPSVSDDS